MSDINIRSSTQKIFVDPASSSVSVINAGPPGPNSGVPGPAAGELAYTQFIADVPISSTNQATPNNVVTTGVKDYDGALIFVHFYSAMVSAPSGPGGGIVLNLWDGNVDLGYIGQVVNPPTGPAPICVTMSAFAKFKPSVGQHEYRIRGFVYGSGSGAGVAAGPGGPGQRFPGFLRITKG